MLDTHNHVFPNNLFGRFHGDISFITGPFGGKSTADQRIPLTKGQ